MVNRGYNTERCILEDSFNDISGWRFDRLGKVFGSLNGYDAATEEAFEEALIYSLNNRTMPSIINVHFSADDAFSAMKRLAGHLKFRVKGGSFE